MEHSRFDGIARQFADLRISRRQALRQGAAGMAAGAIAVGGITQATAQDASPVAADDNAEPMYLFLQSFQQGSIAPIDGEDGKYTLTLEQGLGQTLYFADRPERTVGTAPTAEFIKGFGFSPNNPPNAALVLETAPGDTDIAVVELTNPKYDEEAHTATYDVQLLQHYEQTLGMSFAKQPIDLSKLHPGFGAAHLFIDDCADGNITCTTNDLDYPCPDDGICGSFPTQGFCYSSSQWTCFPCDPYGHLNPSSDEVYTWWDAKCNSTFQACRDLPYQSGCGANFNS